MEKKYYIFVNGEKFEVNKEIYDVYYKGLEKERYFMRTNKKQKIEIKNDEIIFKDSLEISLDKLKEHRFEIKDDFNLEEFVLLSIMIKKLKRALSQLEDEEYKIIVELFFNLKSERELAKDLNTTYRKINYKKQKILDKLYLLLKKIKNY